MYSTTLRLDDGLARFLQEEARVKEMSVNALLADLVRHARDARARHHLSNDWAAYAQNSGAQDAGAQDVAYAHHAQAEVAAEPKAKPYSAKKHP